MGTSIPRIVMESPLDDPSSVFPGPKSNVGVVPNQPRITEATTLKKVVDELIMYDLRFKGLARYIVNVRFFWSTEIQTACAGHGFIFFNPDFYESIPEETRKTVVAHEVWHLILKHLERSVNLDPVMSNIAQDHVINLDLEQQGFTFEGTDPCKDLKYKGMSSDRVYDLIWEKREKNPPKPTPGQASREQILDHIQSVLDQDAAGVSMDQQKEKADKDVESFGKDPGNAPGSKLISLEATKKKVLIVGATYQDIFKKYLIDPLSGGNRTFMRPNRRSHGMRGQTLILPGRYPKRGHLNRLTHLVYALDVSGSITQQQATQFHNSVRTIKEILNPLKLTVMFFDTRVVFQKTFTDKDSYTNIKVSAGGGTDLTDVYRRTEVMDPEALVVFTDLCVHIPPEPKWDTIWLVPNKSVNIQPNIYGNVYLIPS